MLARGSAMCAGAISSPSDYFSRYLFKGSPSNTSICSCSATSIREHTVQIKFLLPKVARTSLRLPPVLYVRWNVIGGRSWRGFRSRCAHHQKGYCILLQITQPRPRGTISNCAGGMPNVYPSDFDPCTIHPGRELHIKCPSHGTVFLVNQIKAIIDYKKPGLH